MQHKFGTFNLVTRTAVFHARQLILTIIAIAISATVISGALVIGDSVRQSLKLIAAQSTGRARTLITTENRWFTTAAIKRLNEQIAPPAAAMIHLTPNLGPVSGESSIKLNLYGINADFFAVAPGKTQTPINIEPGQIALNETAAAQLSVKPGDIVVMRYFKSNSVPIDAPFSLSGSGIETLRVVVAAILSADQGGNFDFRTSQKTAFNGFMNVDYLGQLLGRDGRANMIISAAEEDISHELKASFGLKDYELELEMIDQTIELRSSRVFMGATIFQAVAEMNIEHTPVFGYFVNSISNGENSVPYSFVAGTSGEPEITDDNEIIVNRWLAEKLNANMGDEISVTAYVPGSLGVLNETSTTFRLAGIIDMAEAKNYSRLAPMFPGMENAETCHDWDPALPIDLKRIETDDEEYWYEYKNLPKAFVSFARARQQWKNRFGELTLVLFNNASLDEVEQRLLRSLSPAQNGFNLINLAAEKEFGTSNSIDFAGLFFGLGLFIIIAALLLSSLLLRLYLETRAKDFAIMQTCGFSRADLTLMLLTEIMIYAVLGSLLGTLAGVAYANTMLSLLRSVWQGAVNTPEIYLHVNAGSLSAGFVASVAACYLTLRFSIKSFFAGSRAKVLAAEAIIREPGISSAVIALAMAIVAGLTAPRATSMVQVALFFVAGFLLLYASTQLAILLLHRFRRLRGHPGIRMLAIKNCSRRLDRSQAIVRILAGSLFLLIAVSANQRGMLDDPQQKRSGTGGYALYVETALPVSGGINSPAGRLNYKLEDLPPQVRIAQFPLIEGTDASCTNLNQVSRPTIIGIDTDEFAQRFSFAGFGDSQPDWNLLNESFADPSIIAGITDLDTILWNFKMLPGDYLDIETTTGKTLRIKLVAGLHNSILQGKVLVARDNLYRIWPEAHGSNLFLVEAPQEHLQTTMSTIADALSRHGVHLERSHERLASFNQVQNTYLSIFMVLGLLGLVLGCGGLAVLIKRNILERTTELGYMRVLGFSAAELRRMLFIEHGILFALAMICGTVSAAIAVIPAISSPTGSLPAAEIFIIIAIISATAILTILASIKVPDKKP